MSALAASLRPGNSNNTAEIEPIELRDGGFRSGDTTAARPIENDPPPKSGFVWKSEPPRKGGVE